MRTEIEIKIPALDFFEDKDTMWLNQDEVVRMNIEQLIEDFNLEGIDRCQRTRDWYKVQIKSYLNYLSTEDVPLAVSRAVHLRRYLASLREQGFGWSTRNGRHTALNQFYKWAVLREHTTENPFEIEAIKRPRKPRRIYIPTKLVNVQMVLNVLKKEDTIQAKRDLAIILLLIDAGLRRMELTNLDIENINLNTGQIAVLVAKGDNQRWAYIKPPTIEAIKNWLAIHPTKNGALFLSLKKGNRLDERTINNVLRSWSNKAHLKTHLKPHGLRHLFASSFSQSGGGSKILQDLLGHQNLETTEGYISNSQEEIRRQHKKYSPVNLLEF